VTIGSYESVVRHCLSPSGGGFGSNKWHSWCQSWHPATTAHTHYVNPTSHADIRAFVDDSVQASNPVFPQFFVSSLETACGWPWSWQLWSCLGVGAVTTVLAVALTHCTCCLPLRFNSHFPRGPGLAGTRMSPFWIFLELRMMKLNMNSLAVIIMYVPFQHRLHQVWTNQHSYIYYSLGQLPQRGLPNLLGLLLAPNFYRPEGRPIWHSNNSIKALKFVCLFAWGFTALSAQIGYIGP